MEEKKPGSGVSRRTVLRTLAASPALLISVSDLSAQTNISGYWVLRIPRGDGTNRDMYLDLEQSGQTVSGRIILGSWPWHMPISNGSFRDGKLHFDVTSHFGHGAQKTTYDGVLKGNRLAMQVRFPGRHPRSAMAERTTRAATQPPAPLPLPPLRVVPYNGLVPTPPMGWNSWNLFAGRVDEKIVREAADAMVASGMHKAGYRFINIDDTWAGPRNRKGQITGNRKFPNMKGLADYVHSKGLKIGIYSSPGPKTCAGYTGCYGHVKQDAHTFAEWGFDYLKYDWCSAGTIYKNDQMRPVYQEMGEALLKCGRPIVFSLCQYGLDHVWTWGPKVGGNLWRTTGDIKDNWKRMDYIGFKQFAIQKYISPGHWNDPDMLEVGNGGMTNEEYRTHMSLWCLLAAPLIAGNDLNKMTEATKEILMNREVIAIDQDKAAHPAKLMTPLGTKVVAARDLADGSKAVALFNRGEEPEEVGVEWSSLGLEGKKLEVRDLWKHAPVKASKTHYSTKVPTHGVVMLRVRTTA